MLFQGHVSHDCIVFYPCQVFHFVLQTFSHLSFCGVGRFQQKRHICDFLCFCPGPPSVSGATVASLCGLQFPTEAELQELPLLLTTREGSKGGSLTRFYTTWFWLQFDTDTLYSLQQPFPLQILLKIL